MHVYEYIYSLRHLCLFDSCSSPSQGPPPPGHHSERRLRRHFFNFAQLLPRPRRTYIRSCSVILYFLCQCRIVSVEVYHPLLIQGALVASCLCAPHQAIIAAKIKLPNFPCQTNHQPRTQSRAFFPASVKHVWRRRSSPAGHQEPHSL